MSRPSDWWVLDLDQDPTPGEPAVLRTMARSWGQLADDAEAAQGRVHALMGDAAIGAWVGEAGDAFRSKTGDLPDQLGKCARSYRLASDALTWWAGRLEGHQDDADRALVRGRAARADLEAAQAQAAQAAAALSSAAGSGVLEVSARYAGTSPPADVTMPTSDDVRRAQQRLSSAQAAHASADAAVAAAQSRWDAARALALDASALREADARVVAGRIHEASDAGIPERSRWERFKDWASEAWDVIVQVAKVVVAVLGVVALIIGGPLAWVVFAAALIVLADTLMKYLQGQASLWDVAFSALACIPGTKGLTTLAALKTAFRTGGALGAVAHVGGAIRAAGIQLARSANQLRRGFGPGMRSAFRVLGDARGVNSWAAVRTTAADLVSAFQRSRLQAWDDYVSAVTDPVKKARLWQGSGSYPGVDAYRAAHLPPGTRLEVGVPGISGYTVPEGTAAAAGNHGPAVWEGAQVGPGAATSTHPGYRDHMITLEVLGDDVTSATGVARANPQYGGGGATQHFLPDLRAQLAQGDVVALDASGARITMPSGTTPAQVETVIQNALSGTPGTIYLTGAHSPNPTVATLQEVSGWPAQPNLLGSALRGIGYAHAGEGAVR